MNAPRRIVRFGTTGSTNDEALRLAAAGAPAGTTVVAECQTAGRGRGGHGWESPPGVALYFSILERPRVSVERLPLATLACGVGVARAVRAQTGLAAGLKWPNDLLVAGRKCAGILCEAGDGGAVVCGIGINVNTPREALPARPIFPASSLAAEAGRQFDREALLMACVEAVDAAVARLEEQDGAAATVAAFAELDALRGRRLAVDLPDGTRAEGENLGPAPSGALTLLGADGPFEVLAGSVSLAGA
ncbi:MAG: biotin--[Kiritimatiellae bacterium]|nr:biotin--[acetyl-CoA-carboxylase] ligase [Kiritimatiellia bacterium]